eukprot:11198441-Lingulodinium_polyedra.AAC.1
MDREVARTLGMMKRLARNFGKISHQILSIPPSSWHQLVAQGYARLEPRSSLRPRGLRRSKR